MSAPPRSINGLHRDAVVRALPDLRSASNRLSSVCVSKESETTTKLSELLEYRCFRALLADETGLWKGTVHCYLALFSLQPHRSNSLKLSNDPFFIGKVRVDLHG